jgi:hypothetical protein
MVACRHRDVRKTLTLGSDRRGMFPNAGPGEVVTGVVYVIKSAC